MTYLKVVAAVICFVTSNSQLQYRVALVILPTLTNRKFEHLDFLPYAWPCIHPCLALNNSFMFGLPVCKIIFVFLRQWETAIVNRRIKPCLISHNVMKPNLITHIYQNTSNTQVLRLWTNLLDIWFTVSKNMASWFMITDSSMIVAACILLLQSYDPMTSCIHLIESKMYNTWKPYKFHKNVFHKVNKKW